MGDSSPDSLISEEVELLPITPVRQVRIRCGIPPSKSFIGAIFPAAVSFDSSRLPDSTNSATKDDLSAASPCSLTGLSFCSWIEERLPGGETVN